MKLAIYAGEGTTAEDFIRVVNETSKIKDIKFEEGHVNFIHGRD